MKKLLFLICVVAVSCSKENDPPASTGSNATIKYKVNGAQVQINNSTSTTFPISYVRGVKGNLSPLPPQYDIMAGYSVSSTATDVKNKSVILSIGLDSMVTGITYSLPSTIMKASFMESNYFYFADQDSDSTGFAITITNYNNGLISGAFSGKFRKSDTSGKNLGITDITDGEFSNVPVAY